MPTSVVDVFRAQLHATVYWYKNNKWMLFSIFVWPYLMVMVLLGLGTIMGDISTFSQRLEVANPAFYLLSASAVAMTSVGIVDSVAGFALYNRWLGTLNYIVLSPIREAKLFIAAGLPDSLLTSLVSIVAIAPAAIFFEGFVGGAKLILVLAIVIAGMVPLIGLSVIAASLLLVIKEESNIINSIVPFILLLSGVFYPVTILPESLQAMSYAVPTRYVVDAVKLVARFRTPSGVAILTFFTALAVLGVIYNGMASVAVSRAENAIRRRGVE